MTQNIIIVVVIAVLAIIFGWLALYGEYVIDKKIKRNREVYIFRLWVLDNRSDLYDKLPSYNEMLEDNKARLHLNHIFLNYLIKKFIS